MDRITGKAFASRSEVIAAHGMAATSHPLATQVALDLLRRGGSAVDAAVGANALLGLVEPTGCGLGGDLFAIVWDVGGRRLVGLNASGRSPGGLTLAELRDRGIERIPPHGPLSVSVPGCADGWCELHERYGKLPLADVLGPAVQYAREGAPIPELIAWYWERSARVLGRYPGFADTFLPAGRAPRKGELFRNPGLADTLERLGAEGRDAFYGGEVARTIDAFMRETDGYLRFEDLAEHRSDWVDPVSTEYRGVEVWELPPNGQGIAALQMLNVLEGYDLAGMGFGSAESRPLPSSRPRSWPSRTARASTRIRTFCDIPVEPSLISERIRRDPAARGSTPAARGSRSSRSGEFGPPGSGRHGLPLRPRTRDGQHGVADPEQLPGDGVGHGARRTWDSCLQDRGELFDLTEGRPNSYAPGKRPVPHDHSGLRHQATAETLGHGLRGDGRRHAAPGARPDHRQHGRLRDEPPGGRRRAANPSITGSSQPTGERAAGTAVESFWRRATSGSACASSLAEGP